MEREFTLEVSPSSPHGDDKNILSSSKLCTQITSNFDSNLPAPLNDYRNESEQR